VERRERGEVDPAPDPDPESPTSSYTSSIRTSATLSRTLPHMYSHSDLSPAHLDSTALVPPLPSLSLSHLSPHLIRSLPPPIVLPPPQPLHAIFQEIEGRRRAVSLCVSHLTQPADPPKPGSRLSRGAGATHDHRSGDPREEW
jgi:hypothetical protein